MGKKKESKKDRRIRELEERVKLLENSFNNLARDFTRLQRERNRDDRHRVPGVPSGPLEKGPWFPQPPREIQPYTSPGTSPTITFEQDCGCPINAVCNNYACPRAPRITS